jgi:hypothetical protein
MCLMKPIVKSVSVNMFDTFPVQNGLTQDAFLPLLSNFALEFPFGRCKKTRKDLN